MWGEELVCMVVEVTGMCVHVNRPKPHPKHTCLFVLFLFLLFQPPKEEEKRREGRKKEWWQRQGHHKYLPHTKINAKCGVQRCMSMVCSGGGSGVQGHGAVACLSCFLSVRPSCHHCCLHCLPPSPLSHYLRRPVMFESI